MSDDLIEAWQHTKENAGKFRRIATVMKSGGMRVTEKWIPIYRWHQWHEYEANWYFEMDDRYGDEDD